MSTSTSGSPSPSSLDLPFIHVTSSNNVSPSFDSMHDVLQTIDNDNVSSHDCSSPHPSSQHKSPCITSHPLNSTQDELLNVCPTAHDSSVMYPISNNKCVKPDIQSPTEVVEACPTITAMPYDDQMSIQLNSDNMVLALLPNHEKVLTLVDSGASDSLVCATFVAQSAYLSKLPKISIPVRNFKVGNGSYVSARYAIEIPVTIQRHKFIVRALALDTLGGINLVLGTPALHDMDACLEFRSNRLRFRHSTFPIRLTKTIKLKPKMVRMVTVTAKLPAALRHATLFVRTSNFISQFSAIHMLLKFHKGYASLLVTNPLDHEVTLHSDKAFGFIDLRYLAQMYTSIIATSQDKTHTTLLYTAMHSQQATPKLNHADSGSSAVTNTSDVTREQLYDIKRKQYPFLEDSDPRLKMYDHEIIDRDITFKHSVLDPDQQLKVKQLLFKYKDALSLHSEVGNTKLTIDFDLTDDSPFYIRPYTVSAAEKPIIDRELQKLVQMGVLKEAQTAYSSPVLLIKKKGTKNLRLVTDFRHLNSRIVKRNLPFPLVKEAMQAIGEAQPQVLTVLDLKEAYHCLNLSSRCQDFCGITSYFGGKAFKYLRLPMGLSVSPCEFQCHINSILSSINARKYCIGIMDDLIIYSKSLSDHHKHVENILAALEKNGLKISPAKAKLFRTKVVYMGHEILVNKTTQGIRPLRDRTEAIRKLPVPKTKRQLKGFIGKVSYLAMYLPKLQILLKPLHKISGKKSDFIWGHEQQTSFDKILELLVKPPILSLPRSHGLFRLYVDTSKLGVGASLWQIQDGQERLLAYFSKALAKSAQHYGISELELTGIYIAVSAFRYLLKNTAFEVYTDHASIPQIMKAKTEPTTDRLKRLLEKLSSYAIKIGFCKGSSLVIADYLSRNPICSELSVCDDISFPMLTRKQAAAQRIRMPTVRQTVDNQTSKQVYKPNAPPVVAVAPPAVAVAPPPVAVAPPSVAVAPPPVAVAPPPVAVAPAPVPVDPAPAPDAPVIAPAALPEYQPAQDPPARILPQVPALARAPRERHIEPYIPQRTPQVMTDDVTQVQETHTQPPPALLRKQVPLQLDVEEVITRHLPKQSETNRLLDKISKTRLQNVHLPYNKRELAKLQSQCPNFKDIYDFISEGILPAPKIAARRILSQSEHFVIIDQVLFRLPSHDNAELTIAIPQEIVPEILFMYHDSLLACHQGIARVTATIKQKFYFPRMHQIVTNYIKSCQTCQARKSPVDNERPFHLNIPVNYVPFETVHCDLKTMPPSSRNHKFLLTLVCNITRFVILVPLVNKDAKCVAEAILERCIFQFGPFKEFVSDQGKEWDNTVVAYIFAALKVKQRFVSVGNHKSNKSERFIATVSQLLTSYLTNNGRNWHLFTTSVAYAYNSFASPTLANYSPFYLVYLRHPPTVFACPPTTQVSLGYQEYVTLLKSRLENVGKIMLDIQTKLQHKQAIAQNKKVKNPPTYTVGMLVYVLAPSASSLQIASRKLRLDYVGPFLIKEMLDRSHVILQTLDNKQVNTIIHVCRLKPAWVRCGQEVVGNIVDLKKHNPQMQHVLNNAQNLVNQNRGFLSIFPLSSDSKTKLEKFQPSLSPAEYSIKKCRYKLGELQFLLDTQNCYKHNLWCSLSVDPPANLSVDNLIYDSKIPISGSKSKFYKWFY